MIAGTSSCLLGSTKIRMLDGSQKEIKDIVPGEKILDGLLKPQTVLSVIHNYLGSRSMYMFEEGPIFTPEHQFYYDIEKKNIGVYRNKRSYIHPSFINPTQLEWTCLNFFDTFAKVIWHRQALKIK